jgi:hypothetical protein
MPQTRSGPGEDAKTAKRKNTGKNILVSAPSRLHEYLEDLRLMEGFGSSKAEIMRNFTWKEVNRLIEAGRLPPRRDPSS